MASILHDKGFRGEHSGLQKKRTPYDCAFSVVRDPMSRFISAYYTINWYEYRNVHSKVTNFSFWNIHGEPQRFRAFVDDLIKNPFEFVRHGMLNHVISQTQILSLAPVDFNYILRVKHFKDQLKLLAKPEFCGEDAFNSLIFKHQMKSEGGFGRGYNDKTYSEYMDFKSYQNHSLLPAWYALDYETWHKITEYYKQDYACLAFKPNFEEILNKVTL
eukprot:89843_1